MTLQQVNRFLEESVAAGQHWDDIVIIGGEPAIHGQFLEVVDAVRRYRTLHSPNTRIEIFTNGYGDKVRRAIALLPQDVILENSAKNGKEQAVSYHRSFNVAPVDLPAYRNADYRNGCWITQTCGIALGPSGYYPCGAAAGMDRIFGWDIGRKSLPPEEDTMHDLLSAFCRNCGHFKREIESPPTLPVQSPAWKHAYSAYRKTKPQLTIYGAPLAEPLVHIQNLEDSADSK